MLVVRLRLIGLVTIAAGAIVMLGTCGAETACGEVLPGVLCPKVAVSGDGVDDGSFWGDCGAISGFVAGPEGRFVALNSQPIVRMAWNDDALLMQLVVHEKDMSALTVTDVGRDGRIWWDNAMEIFIDPERRGAGYYHFIVNTAGTYLDEQGRDKSWNGDWSVVIDKGERAWVATIEMPFATLGVRPKAGDCWGVNFCRIRPSGRWSPVAHNNYHQPDKFGLLYFVDEGFGEDEVVRDLAKKGTGAYRVFLRDGFAEIDGGAVTRVDYREQSERELTQAGYWLDKLGELDMSYASDEQKARYDELVGEIDAARREAGEASTELILQWVGSVRLSDKLQAKVETLYWEIKAEELYDTIERK